MDYNGGSGPQSAHSMASGLSRSGSFAPSTLSVLYENQAMKVEREELKSELKLISARVWSRALCRCTPYAVTHTTKSACIDR